MARPAITYKEMFKCPNCDKTIELYVPNAKVSHPCRVNNKLKLVALESVSVWRKEGDKSEGREVREQGILNL
jgi:hypothetical protein